MPFLWSCSAMALSLNHTCASLCFTTSSRPMTNFCFVWLRRSVRAVQAAPAATSVMQPAMPCQYRVTWQQEAWRRFDSQTPCISPAPPRIPWIHISYEYFVLNLDIPECFLFFASKVHGRKTKVCESLQSMMSSWMQQIPRIKWNNFTNKDEILSPMFLRMQLICSFHRLLS